MNRPDDPAASAADSVDPPSPGATDRPSTADLSLGGGGESFAYPALALDPDGMGFWGKIDLATERMTALLNPILVKEARQSLKSRQFLITFFCLLAASCAWTIMGIVFNAPDVYYIPSGGSMMIGYFLILSYDRGIICVRSFFHMNNRISEDLIFSFLSNSRAL